MSDALLSCSTLFVSTEGGILQEFSSFSCFDKDGILRRTPGKYLQELDRGPLTEKEKIVAFPAFVDGRIYMRGTTDLWCV